MFVLDTNVVSELRRARPHGAVLAWLKSVDDSRLYLSAVTIGEIQRGIEVTREANPSRARELQRWLAEVEDAWNVLPMTAACFRRWAEMTHRRPAAQAMDAMIAATAAVHGFGVATRNIKDFKPFGVDLVDPFAG